LPGASGDVRCACPCHRDPGRGGGQDGRLRAAVPRDPWLDQRGDLGRFNRGCPM
jgi:hypothetical protein